MMLCSVVIAVAGCAPVELYERTVNIPNAAWQQEYVPEFSFNVPDSTRYYNVFVVMRHTNRYPVRNVYMNIAIKYPADSVARVQQFNLPLASGEQWLGNGMGDIYERRVQLFAQPVRFNHSGQVTFSLQHNMRINPLPHVMQVGLRVEPAP